MTITKNIIICCILFNIGYAFSQETVIKDKEGSQAAFDIDRSNGTITVKLNDKTYLYKNIVGSEGQIYKDFTIFNNQPAL